MISVERILQLLVYLSALVGVLPVVSFLPWWVLLLLLAALWVGGVDQRRGHFRLTSLPATLLSTTFLLLFVLQVTRTNLVEPLIHFLCLLLAVRLATEKSARNILQLFLLSTIILAASSLLTLDMAYLFYLVMMVVLVTSGLLLLCFYAADSQLRFNRSDWRQLLKVGCLLSSGSLLLMVLFFIILPRTQTPLWNFLNPNTTAKTGMTDQVRPGSVTALAQSSQTAFRVETDRLPENSLYWRGIVLNQLDGQIWKRSGGLFSEKVAFTDDPEVLLNFFSEAKAGQYLVTLDHPRTVEGLRHELTADGVVVARSKAERKVRYLVRSQYTARRLQHGPVDQYLLFPDNLTERLLDLGEQIAQGASYDAKLAKLNDFFIQQQFRYSSLQLPPTTDPVDTFLFESKRGYCEYFASSYALLLRISGVPTRLVGGYLGGDYNPLGGYYMVGEDLAHVWVEALDDQGVWQRLDPSRLAINAEQALWQSRRQGFASFQAFSDAMLHYWSRLVLNYDLHQQFQILRQVAMQVRDIKSIQLASFVKLLWLVPLVLIVLYIVYSKQLKSPEKRLISAYRKQLLRRCQLEELPELGLFELARLLDEPLCQEFAEIYGRAYYRDQSLNSTDFKHLKSIIRELSKGRSSIEVAIPRTVSDNTKQQG